MLTCFYQKKCYNVLKEVKKMVVKSSGIKTKVLAFTMGIMSLVKPVTAQKNIQNFDRKIDKTETVAKPKPNTYLEKLVTKKVGLDINTLQVVDQDGMGTYILFAADNGLIWFGETDAYGAVVKKDGVKYIYSDDTARGKFKPLTDAGIIQMIKTLIKAVMSKDTPIYVAVLSGSKVNEQIKATVKSGESR